MCGELSGEEMENEGVEETKGACRAKLVDSR